MSNLFVSMNAAASALQAFDRALAVTQNNLNNATTPGYVRQDAVLTAGAFDPLTAQPGGVRTQVRSAGNAYAEEVVRSQSSALSRANAESTALTYIAQVLDYSANGGLNGALQQLLNSFSDWSDAPGDSSLRQNVLIQAQQLVGAFRQTSYHLLQYAADLEQQARQLTDTINGLTAKLRDLAQARGPGGFSDAGAEAQFNAAVQELSELADVSVSWQQDGALALRLGPETAVVLGGKWSSLDLSVDAPGIRVKTANGIDLTDRISGGELAGVLQARNQVLASLLGDGEAPGDLNLLAQRLADRVNSLQQEAGGEPLFVYQEASPAATLELNPDLDASGLAEGAAAALGAMADASDSRDQVDGLGYSAFFARLSERIARQQVAAQDRRSHHEELLQQAHDLREQESGVSIEEETVNLLQLQRAYQAAARMISVLDELADTLLTTVG